MRSNCSYDAISSLLPHCLLHLMPQIKVVNVHQLDDSFRNRERFCDSSIQLPSYPQQFFLPTIHQKPSPIQVVARHSDYRIPTDYG